MTAVVVFFAKIALAIGLARFLFGFVEPDDFRRMGPSWRKPL